MCLYYGEPAKCPVNEAVEERGNLVARDQPGKKGLPPRRANNLLCRLVLVLKLAINVLNRVTVTQRSPTWSGIFLLFLGHIP